MWYVCAVAYYNDSAAVAHPRTNGVGLLLTCPSMVLFFRFLVGGSTPMCVVQARVRDGHGGFEPGASIHIACGMCDRKLHAMQCMWQLLLSVLPLVMWWDGVPSSSIGQLHICLTLFHCSRCDALSPRSWNGSFLILGWVQQSRSVHA